MNSFLGYDEIKNIGFKYFGENVKISRYARFYSPELISIGNNVRIDDFCILSGKIETGDNIHISAYTGLFAGNTGIKLEDYTTISSRCAIYAESDDYSGEYLTNPMVDDKYRNVISGQVILKKYSIIASGCTVLPNVEIGEGVAVGAMSLVKTSLKAWGIYGGIPVTFIKERSRNILNIVDSI